MGVYTTFYTVIGVRLTMDKMLGNLPKENRTVKSCEHSNVERSGPYCSKCGRKVSEYTEEIRPDAHEELYEYLIGNHPCVQDLKTGEDSGFLLGIMVSLSPHDNPNYEEIRLTESTVWDAVETINEVLEGSPVPIKYRTEPDDVSIHCYMDQR